MNLIKKILEWFGRRKMQRIEARRISQQIKVSTIPIRKMRNDKSDRAFELKKKSLAGLRKA